MEGAIISEREYTKLMVISKKYEKLQGLLYEIETDLILSRGMLCNLGYKNTGIYDILTEVIQKVRND